MKAHNTLSKVLGLIILSSIIISTPALSQGAAADAWFGDSMTAGDFNGDGQIDLAVGARCDTVGDARQAGGVYIFMNQGGSLSTTPQIFNRGSDDAKTDLAGAPAAGDNLGHTMAAGDFNGDGFDDLAIGAPGTDFADADNSGSVFIIYGSTAGLDARLQPEAVFHQDNAVEYSESEMTHRYDLPGAIQASGQAGWALAAGDFNQDGFADLAVGAPGYNINKAIDAGAVILVSGSAQGLNGHTNQSAIFMQTNNYDEQYDLLDNAETGDNLGAALAAGDFNGDNVADLAIGAPGESIGAAGSAGMVTVVYGAAGAGLSAQGKMQGFDQNGAASGHVGNLAGLSDYGDELGYSLAAGDFNGDGFDDLAIGAPFEDVDGVADAGAILVVQGSAGGLNAALNNAAAFDQNGAISGGERFNLSGDAAQYDYTGSALTSGDFNGDGFADLAVGISHKDIARVTNAGMVAMIYGSDTGLDARIFDHSGFDQDGFNSGAAFDLPGGVDVNDLVGAALIAGDFNGDSITDLAIGAPREDVGNMTDAGADMIVYGSADGANVQAITPQTMSAEGAF